MLPLWERVDQVEMAMKGYSAFPKAPVLVEPPHPIVYLFGFYDISTFVGYLMPNTFLYK